ncbi:high mobility group nucleosome-binding domain-containing protein 5 isoform X3 [Procambarus clarkii]|uniref:high mobility group nucleosome-binding domain-containing protein 5 isoform X3 n=1 Tax=Procambarus clarkii TaxID=6728 RepID=UPI0037426F3F
MMADVRQALRREVKDEIHVINSYLEDLQNRKAELAGAVKGVTTVIESLRLAVIELKGKTSASSQKCERPSRQEAHQKREEIAVQTIIDKDKVEDDITQKKEQENTNEKEERVTNVEKTGKEVDEVKEKEDRVTKVEETGKEVDEVMEKEERVTNVETGKEVDEVKEKEDRVTKVEETGKEVDEVKEKEEPQQVDVEQSEAAVTEDEEDKAEISLSDSDEKYLKKMFEDIEKFSINENFEPTCFLLNIFDTDKVKDDITQKKEHENTNKKEERVTKVEETGKEVDEVKEKEDRVTKVEETGKEVDEVKEKEGRVTNVETGKEVDEVKEKEEPQQEDVEQSEAAVTEDEEDRSSDSSELSLDTTLEDLEKMEEDLSVIENCETAGFLLDILYGIRQKVEDICVEVLALKGHRENLMNEKTFLEESSKKLVSERSKLP